MEASEREMDLVWWIRPIERRRLNSRLSPKVILEQPDSHIESLTERPAG